jgi:L,D-peptidoglycan transpeptidase YkuD (ErfK/YbiS/YcfS/YnhG family)
MQAGFQDQLKQQAAQFAAMQKAQEDRMIALQEQMKQAQAASAERPTVAGVKTATGSAGTDMQIARRGVRGAFGRAGMRIQSLNV